MATKKTSTKNPKLNKNQISIDEVVANKKPAKKLTEAEKQAGVESIKQAIKQVEDSKAKPVSVNTSVQKAQVKPEAKPTEKVVEAKDVKAEEPKAEVVTNQPNVPDAKPTEVKIPEPKTEPKNVETGRGLTRKEKKKKYKSRILTAEEVNPKLKKKKPKTKKRKKNFSLDDVERYEVDPKMGLTTEQVHKRVADRLTNKVDKKTGKSYAAIFITNICTFFNLVCISVAAALIAVGAWKNCMFMVIILANVTIGIFQEIKAKLTVQKISLVTEPVATVIRDGLQQNVPVAEVVLDDIILFSTGKQICADCVMMDGEVEANESLLTGESVPVKKRKGDVLYSGSFIS
ncbi:MAG: hypothetical protein K2G88_05330 [Oscillospiraceae bacterium]|nr:hypothetical protein [Oscillospiraceae bacterium]